MALKKRTNDPFNNDIQGQPARLTLPSMPRDLLYAQQLRAVGDNNGNPATFEELVESLTFELGDTEKIVVTPSLHLALARHLNRTGNTARSDTLFINFASISTAQSPIGTKDVGSISVIANIKADAGNIVYEKMESLTHYRSMKEPVPRGPMYRQKEHIHTKVIKGWNSVTELPIQDLAFLSQLVIDSPNVKEVRCFIGDDKRIDAKVEHIDGWQREDPTKNAQGVASRVILDFEDYGDAKEAYNLAEGDFRLEYKFDETQNLPANGVKMLIRGIEI